MKRMLRRLLAVLCTVLLLVGSASALTLEQAVGMLEHYYVDELPDAAYEARTVKELFEALGDPYSYYMDKDSYTAFIEGVEGASRVGIGVSISYTEAGIVINTIIPGGAAEELGLVPGDTITAIDGGSCAPAQESDVARIAGPEGTRVALTILHQDGSSEVVQATRKPFTVPTITVELLENGVGYINCDSFASDAGEVFAGAMEEYGEAQLWLVDLRSNGGGLADSAVASAGVFTGPGFLLYFRDRDGNYFPSLHLDSAMTQAPVVVLTNGYTASASEIFAAAVKDFGAGIAVGTRTYGKGVAQIVLDNSIMPYLFDGDAMKITAYRFYTGAANTTDCVGVLPTLLIRDELAAAAAGLLRGEAPADGQGWLRVTLGGRQFYIDATRARETEEGTAALAELFAALPPDTPVSVWAEGLWLNVNVLFAASFLDVEYQSRWFSDVEGSRFAGKLNALATYGLLEGDGRGSFYPGNTLTRAELCALVCQTLDRVSPSPSPFSDVQDGSWYAPYITTLYQMGLVEGKGDGSFGPGDQVTVQEFITILGRLAGFLNTNCRDLLDGVTEEELSGGALDGFAGWARSGAWLLGGGYAERVLGEEANMLFADLAELDPAALLLREEAGASLYDTLTVLGVLSY